MDLGSSIRRRRKGKGGGTRSRKEPRRLKMPRLKMPRVKKPRGTAARRRERPPRRAGSRLRQVVLALVVAGAGLGSGYVLATTSFFPPGEPPPELQGVPGLAGHSLESAVALLADSSLVVGQIDSVRHPVAVAGTVIGQSPLPGRTALQRAPVRVAVSLGPEIRAVPDVTRLHGGRATLVLEAGGFVVEVDTIESGTPAGRVIGIDPVPGTELALPGIVRMAVSSGPPTFPMPDLSGVRAQEALTTLASLGLVLSAMETRYSILNVNTVFGQYPDPNVPVELGTAVRLIVGEEMRRWVRDPIGSDR